MCLWPQLLEATSNLARLLDRLLQATTGHIGKYLYFIPVNKIAIYIIQTPCNCFNNHGLRYGHPLSKPILK